MGAFVVFFCVVENMREKSMPKTRGEAIIKNRYCINLVSVII